MINYDNVSCKRKHKQTNLNWPQISDHQYRIIIGDSEYGKTNALFNLIRNHDMEEKQSYVTWIEFYSPHKNRRH